MRLILDLCAGSGAWSEPYLKAGYEVVRYDLPEGDVRLLKWEDFRKPVHGILAAPPCTAFSYARNRYPASDDELRAALSVVDACLRAAVIYRPRWWALENPRARLCWYLGPPAWTFRQYQYGDDGDKPTALWGTFTPPLPTAPTNAHRARPSSWRTSRQNADPEDAVTQPLFAQAFFEANP